jgi:hypothetical protein
MLYRSCRLVFHTANKILFTYIPRKETARPHSQFLHSFICERFIYPTIGPPILSVFLQPSRQTDRSQIYECRNKD